MGELGTKFGLSESELNSLPKTSDDRYFVYGDVLIPDFEIGAGVKTNIWPNGRFVFDFAPGISLAEQNAFVDACAAWTVGTPITCRLRAGEADYVRVETHTGSECGGVFTSCSPVGRVGGRQPLYVYSGHWGQPSVLQHEIGHALGKVHEQSRSDRDLFVDIKFANIQPHAVYNFRIAGDARILSEYDYGSIMHYRNCAFSIHSDCTALTPDKQTIVTRHCTIDDTGGSSITDSDRDGIRNAYAPGLQSVLKRGRSPGCGFAPYHPDQLGNATTFGELSPYTITWRKVDPPKYSSTCGFAPIGFGLGCTPPKEYKNHWTDVDKSLNPSCPSKYEVWVECGCKVAQQQRVCTLIDAFLSDYDSLAEKAFQNKDQWRLNRLLYFNKVFVSLDSEGLVGPDLVQYIPIFYQLNFLDQRFESKMAKLRSGMHSYAKWKNSIDPTYKLDLVKFQKIAKYRKLRTE